MVKSSSETKSSPELLECRHQSVAGHGINSKIVGPRHCLSCQKCVDDRFLCSLHRRVKECVHARIGKHVDLYDVCIVAGTRVCRRESEKNVAGAVPAEATRSPNTQGHPVHESLQLMRE